MDQLKNLSTIKKKECPNDFNSIQSILDSEDRRTNILESESNFKYTTKMAQKDSAESDKENYNTSKNPKKIISYNNNKDKTPHMTSPSKEKNLPKFNGSNISMVYF